MILFDNKFDSSQNQNSGQKVGRLSNDYCYLKRMNLHWSKHLERLSASLLAQIERIRNASDHGTTIGNGLECVLRRTIEDYLPRYFEVGTGQVCNIKQELSPQLDILIHDRSCFPPLAVNEDGSVIVCSEPTKSVVECKTKWKQASNQNEFVKFTIA